MKNIVNFNNNRYLIIRTLKDDPNLIIDDWKSFLQSDTVLKNNGLLYFCNLIPDAIIIEDSEINEQPQETKKEISYEI